MTTKIIYSEDFHMNKQKTYKIGDTFYNKSSGLVMLTATLMPDNDDDVFIVSLTSLLSGSSYLDKFVHVKSLLEITEEEFSQICDGEKFIPVDLEIKVCN